MDGKPDRKPRRGPKTADERIAELEADPAYRQRIAESLYHGIAKYVGGLSGVKLAAKTSPATGE